MSGSRGEKLRGLIFVNGVLLILVLLWLIPTFGLFISSFRDRFDIQTSGWWTIFPHREWVVTEEIDPREIGLDATAEMDVAGVIATFKQLREGVETADGKRVQWIGNRDDCSGCPRHIERLVLRRWQP